MVISLVTQYSLFWEIIATKQIKILVSIVRPRENCCWFFIIWKFTMSHTAWYNLKETCVFSNSCLLRFFTVSKREHWLLCLFQIESSVKNNGLYYWTNSCIDIVI